MPLYLIIVRLQFLQRQCFDTPVKVTDTPISTGSLQFTGSALVFHKTIGEPFTVTYTIDAVARTPNN